MESVGSANKRRAYAKSCVCHLREGFDAGLEFHLDRPVVSEPVGFDLYDVCGLVSCREIR